MIHLDVLILEFVSNNLLAISLFIGLLKGVATITPWSWDNKIATLFENLYKSIGNKNDKNTNTSRNKNT